MSSKRGPFCSIGILAAIRTIMIQSIRICQTTLVKPPSSGVSLGAAMGATIIVCVFGWKLRVTVEKINAKINARCIFSTRDMDVEMSLSGLFACLAPCKGIQDGLGFWIPSRGFRFRCQRNLDYWLQSLVGSGLLVIFSKAHDCRFHELKFPWFWNQDYHT